GHTLVERARYDLQRLAVVGVEDQQPQGARVVALEHLAERGEVAQRLRHLLTTDLDHAVVDPCAREQLSRATGLGTFVFVVREYEIVAPTVDIEVRAEQLQGHRDALDVPPRASRPPWRGPCGFAGLG